MADGSVAVRDQRQRKKDLLERLEREADIWVASADGHGVPCLVPLSFLWDGEAVWLSTRRTNPTGRNLNEVGRARLSLADTRDVVLIAGTVEVFGLDEVPVATADAFAATSRWDPRRPGNGPSYAYYRVTPTEVQVWYEEAELPARHLMRDGVWAV
ncbi:pyridoxamine 5'-phosphate oxidase family protein [Streptomyces sp. NEAU-Y11]|uniref:pyridoxamine 5'-phosphate oxidase family protein n=1 Tax=Streptomyces cucumeris TaxID=2962890 RepID=UPI0020C8BB1F|nr:pyridoxamine 5'-phosphate oxidase family protein [Streptomyces sp. NEAU-Y11]MCP9207321.1 pyridoxamine 5'-phosphate oxidase family protein [Streptomyces sp. NEAU-Y11]